jgi:hypothetical protein
MYIVEGNEEGIVVWVGLLIVCVVAGVLGILCAVYYWRWYALVVLVMPLGIGVIWRARQ